MSMENELKRIADALERIADAKAVNATVTTVPMTETVVDEGQPVTKRKRAKAVPVAEPAISTGPELMIYCNTQLVGIKDAVKRTATIKAVVKMFANNYGVKAIKELEDDKVAAAKADFDALVGGA